MPKYEKFLKEILNSKKKLADFETIALSGECSAIVLKKLPPKLKDPRSFTIPCTIDVGPNWGGIKILNLFNRMTHEY